MSKINLKQYVLFADLDQRGLVAIENIAVLKNISANNAIFYADEPAQTLFLVQKGKVDLIKSSTEGKEQLIRQVNSGEIFAEAAMFSGTTYPVNAITRTDCELILINKKDLLRLIKIHPEISFKMMGAMANLLRHLNNLISELSLGSVSSRLALFLFKRFRQEGKNKFSLGLPKKELAFQLGTIPETLSRTLKKMKKSGLIQVEKDKVTIKDPEQLTTLLT
ncbi:MAG: Crp/Fnr family transcriptional regulator [Pseudomonadota bacterium]